MQGRLIGIARRSGRRASMEEMASGLISRESGLEGDYRGAKFPRRQITVLAREDWDAALLDIPDLLGAVVLPWTARRANLLVEGVRLPRAKGAVLLVGDVRLEVTGQTNPCRRMEEVRAGLLKALHPQWRGGVTCLVREAGAVAIGDRVIVESAPREHVMRLP